MGGLLDRGSLIGVFFRLMSKKIPVTVLDRHPSASVRFILDNPGSLIYSPEGRTLSEATFHYGEMIAQARTSCPAL